MPLIKPPKPDPSLDRFVDGAGVLSRDGEFAGHIFTARSWFLSPLTPFRRQWCIWHIIVWADGSRERSTEDYPPWQTVAELLEGHLCWESGDPTRDGRYEVRWLEAAAAREVRDRLGISPKDF